jgi:predicted O-methyltransferase YrrM
MLKEIDYDFFNNFQLEIYNKYAYQLDKLKPYPTFWFYDAKLGRKVYRYMYSHNYYLEYARQFQHKRNTSIKVLEIGVNTGHSLLLWKRYFPNATIYGIDIDLTISHNGVTSKEFLKDEKRIKLFEFDACKKENVDKFLKENGGDFDIIIEDGSHLGHHQILSTLLYMPLLKKNGIMVIEDIGLYYGASKDKYMIMEHQNNNTEQIKREIEWGVPMYEYFMENYKNISKDIFHKLNPFTLNDNDIKMLDNIDVKWIDPFWSEIHLKDINLKGENKQMSVEGNSKMAFLKFKQ